MHQMARCLCICFFLSLTEKQVASFSPDSSENDEASLLQLLDRSTIIQNQRQDVSKAYVEPLPPGSLGGSQPPCPGYITNVLGTPHLGTTDIMCDVEYFGSEGEGIDESLGFLGGIRWHPTEETLYYTAMNVVRKIDPETGKIVTLAGSRGSCPGSVGADCSSEACANPGDGGDAFDANFNSAHAVEFNFDTGGLYVVDSWNHAIRYIDPKTNIITSVVGQAAKALAGYAGDGGPATEALMFYPHGLSRDQATGDLYIPDAINGAVRKVDGKTGIISSLWKVEGSFPCQLQLIPRTQGGLDIYMADLTGGYVYKIDSITGGSTILAGKKSSQTGEMATGDGLLAVDAYLDGPAGAQYDITTGDLYISLWKGSTIMKVENKTGIITTIAGKTGQHIADESYAGEFPIINASLGLSDFGDGGPMENAIFSGPSDLEWVSERRMLIVNDATAGSARLMQL